MENRLEEMRQAVGTPASRTVQQPGKAMGAETGQRGKEMDTFGRGTKCREQNRKHVV